jgi:hypothetical protein
MTVPSHDITVETTGCTAWDHDEAGDRVPCSDCVRQHLEGLIAARDAELASERELSEKRWKACDVFEAEIERLRVADRERTEGLTAANAVYAGRMSTMEARVAQLEARIVELRDDCDDAEALRQVVDEVARWRHTALPASIVSAYDRMMERAALEPVSPADKLPCLHLELAHGGRECLRCGKVMTP